MMIVCVLVCVFMHAFVCVRAFAFRSYCRIQFARKIVSNVSISIRSDSWSIYWANGKATISQHHLNASQPSQGYFSQAIPAPQFATTVSDSAG